MITIQDGVNKDGCGRHAAKRFTMLFRREHPHPGTITAGDAHFDLEVPVLQHTEIRPDGKTTTRALTTDLPLQKERMMPMMKDARARRRIENETFRTLKSQANGHHYLSSVPAHLCMLVLMMEKIEQLCCPHFQRALKQQVHRKCMWEEMRLILFRVHLNGWDTPCRLLSSRDWGMEGETGCPGPGPASAIGADPGAVEEADLKIDVRPVQGEPPCTTRTRVS